MNILGMFRRQQTPTRATDLDLEASVQQLKKAIAGLKAGKTLDQSVVDQLDVAATAAGTVLQHRKAITEEIVTPVARELRVGKVFVWLGLALSFFGVLTADITNANTLLGRSYKWVSSHWLPANHTARITELTHGFEQTTTAVNPRAEFDNTTASLSDALRTKDAGKPQIDSLIKDLAEKVANNPNEPLYLSLHSYAYVAAAVHILKKPDIANQFLSSQPPKHGTEFPFASILDLYAANAASANERLTRLDELSRDRAAAEKMGDLRFLGPHGEVQAWAESIQSLRSDAVRRWFISTNGKILFVNDSRASIPSLATRARDEFIKISSLPIEATGVSSEKVSHGGADKLYLYFRSDTERSIYGDMLSNTFGGKKPRVEKSLYSEIKNTDVKKLFSDDSSISIVVRLPGAWQR